MITNLKKFSFVALAAVTSLTLSSCSRDISSSTYTSSSVDEAVRTEEGVVVAKRNVKVKEADKLSGNTAGMAAGGIAGGVLGSQVGGGRGSVLAAVGGAALGAIAGTFAQDKLSTQTAIEYTVKLNTGKLLTVVQGADMDLPVGQRVLVQISYEGRSRIRPF